MSTKILIIISALLLSSIGLNKCQYSKGEELKKENSNLVASYNDLLNSLDNLRETNQKLNNELTKRLVTIDSIRSKTLENLSKSGTKKIKIIYR
jgi:hypothetical protein